MSAKSASDINKHKLTHPPAEFFFCLFWLWMSRLGAKFHIGLLKKHVSNGLVYNSVPLTSNQHETWVASHPTWCFTNKLLYKESELFLASCSLILCTSAGSELRGKEDELPAANICERTIIVIRHVPPFFYTRCVEADSFSSTHEQSVVGKHTKMRSLYTT